MLALVSAFFVGPPIPHDELRIGRQIAGWNLIDGMDFRWQNEPR
jgi:hypothetical protein